MIRSVHGNRRIDPLPIAGDMVYRNDNLLYTGRDMVEEGVCRKQRLPF